MRTTEIVLPGIVEPEGLEIRQRELAPPGPGEAQVRVEATGISFAEQQMRRGKYFDQPPFPFVPGYDLVGTVEAVGSGADPALVGARVAATTKIGAWAERAIVDARSLVPVPEGLGAAAAEVAVVNGVTAIRLLRLGKARARQTVVVLGAAGGVGSILVQLARLEGLRVIGVVSGAQRDAASRLGAIPIDHRVEDVKARVRALAPEGVAAVFDHVGGEGVVDSWAMLASGGTLVSYGSLATRDVPGDPKGLIYALVGKLQAMAAEDPSRHAEFFNLWAGIEEPDAFWAAMRTDLAHVLRLVADGKLTAPIAAELPLDEVARAIRLAETRGTVGKVVLLPFSRR